MGNLMKSLFFITLAAYLFVEVILKKKTHNKNTKISKSKRNKNKQLPYDQKFAKYPSPPPTPSYGSLTDPNHNNGPQTSLTTGTYSSGGQMYQAKPGDSIPYGTGYSYGDWQKVNRKTKK